MPKAFPLFEFASLNFTASPSALAGLAILWALLAGMGSALLQMPLATALAAGLAGALLHFLSEPLGFTDGSTLLRWWGKS